MKITVLGAGDYGTALGDILINNGHDVVYYDPFLLKTTLEDALFKTEMILLAVPSNILDDLFLKLPKNIPLMVATKGILTEKELSSFLDFMILSGPGFADEIKARKKTSLTITDSRISDLFSNDCFEFELTDDVRGVLMCGALKNVYAILAGYRNLLPGNDDWSSFIKSALLEMRELLEINGANGDTVDLSCGVGDLKLTCNIPSRNYQFGMNLAQNPKYLPEKTVEGLSVIHRIHNGTIVFPESALLLKEVLDVVKQ